MSGSITVNLNAGLGNQLFQLAFLEYMSKRNNIPIRLTSLRSPHTDHSNVNYFESIFKRWSETPIHTQYRRINEDSLVLDIDPSSNIGYHGYFQDYKFTDAIRDTFIPKLTFDTSILDKYPHINTQFFIHVRGGDYLNQCKSIHYVNLVSYYEKCIKLCHGEEFVIFTNDKDYSKQIFGSRFPIIDESEVDSLYLMSQCKGCICANSTFSWWGAYLNSTRPIYMPSTWYNNYKYGYYYFDGVVIVDV